MVFTTDEMRRRQSSALINMKPSSVVFTRRPVVSDGAGGKTKGAPVALPEQTMRLVPANAVGNEAPVHTTADGRTVTPDWFLIGPFDSDVIKGDKTTVQGHRLEVVYVSSAPTERVVAECWEEKPGAPPP